MPGNKTTVDERKTAEMRADLTMLYFAYGSNMLLRRLRAKNRAPSAVAVCTGYVEGRRLDFCKLSVDGSGKCDIEATGSPRDRAWGVIFRISAADKPALDRVEGLGKGYADRQVQVVTPGGVMNAFTYVALMKAPSLRPYHWYKAFVVAGARENGLPDDYIGWLATFESQADPDSGRSKSNEALLRGKKT
jgi:gamma-glutamylcyclotransferase